MNYCQSLVDKAVGMDNQTFPRQKGMWVWNSLSTFIIAFNIHCPAFTLSAGAVQMYNCMCAEE